MVSETVGSDAALIGLDWGTSSLRAFLIGASGSVLEEVTTAQGIVHIEDRDFDGIFHEAVQSWIGNLPVPVIASGMIASRDGWYETPYVDLPAGKHELAAALVPFESSQGIVIQFVTGVTADHDGAPDVMRGEETQIVGATAIILGDGVFVLPGTHSKWLRVEDGLIQDYKTCMTGELFAALENHTILGVLMTDGPFHAEGFKRGVRDGLATGADLLHALFRVRTLPLFDKISNDTVEIHGRSRQAHGARYRVSSRAGRCQPKPGLRADRGRVRRYHSADLADRLEEPARRRRSPNHDRNPCRNRRSGCGGRSQDSG